MSNHPECFDDGPRSRVSYLRRSGVSVFGVRLETRGSAVSGRSPSLSVRKSNTVKNGVGFGTFESNDRRLVSGVFDPKGRGYGQNPNRCLTDATVTRVRRVRWGFPSRAAVTRRTLNRRLSPNRSSLTTPSATSPLCTALSTLQNRSGRVAGCRPSNGRPVDGRPARVRLRPTGYNCHTGRSSQPPSTSPSVVHNSVVRGW